MVNKRLVKNIMLILLILCIIDITYLTSFKLNAFNKGFYSREFSKYDIYGKFPGEDIDKVNSELLLYLRDKSDDFDISLFNDNEIKHLKDVKVLINWLEVYYYSLIIVSIMLIVTLFLLSRKNFLKSLSFALFFSGLGVLLFTIILLILIILNFDGVFTVFHRIFFPQGGYLFSASDNIIKLYPFGLFYDIAKNIFMNIVFYGNILIGVGVLLSRK